MALLLGVVTDYTIFYVMALQSRLPDTPALARRGRRGGRNGHPDRRRRRRHRGRGHRRPARGPIQLLPSVWPGHGPRRARRLSGLGHPRAGAPGHPRAEGLLAPRPHPPAHPTTTQPNRARPVPGGTANPVRHLINRAVAAVVVISGVALLGVASIAVRQLELGVGFTSHCHPTTPSGRRPRGERRLRPASVLPARCRPTTPSASPPARRAPPSRRASPRRRQSSSSSRGSPARSTSWPPSRATSRNNRA